MRSNASGGSIVSSVGGTTALAVSMFRAANLRAQTRLVVTWRLFVTVVAEARADSRNRVSNPRDVPR
jgi:hypothetical protein